MALVRMALGKYRCFAEKQQIDLAPITVVLGRNNAGKSALVRAPVLLAAGMHTDAPEPFDLSAVSEDLVDSFPDLVHGRPVHRGSIDIEMGLETPTGLIRVAATVQHLADFHTQVLDRLELLSGGERIYLLEWDLNTYTLTTPSQVWENAPMSFKGLLPGVLDGTDGFYLPDNLVTQAFHAEHAARAAFPAVRYLGPFRERPRRRYRLPRRLGTEVGPAGEQAAGILVDDVARGQGELLRNVNDGLAAHLPGWRVGVMPDGGTWSVVLTSTTDENVRVNLADTGTGVAQVLPIFVQRAIDRLRPPGRPVLEIIEQPELHLHPAAHADLADLFLAAVKDTDTRFLIETHSETFLLRLRRRIAEGLDPATVSVYFVDRVDGASTARRIHIDTDGNLDYWPTGVFGEDYAETKELARAQRERRVRAS